MFGHYIKKNKDRINYTTNEENNCIKKNRAWRLHQGLFLRYGEQRLQAQQWLNMIRGQWHKQRLNAELFVSTQLGNSKIYERVMHDEGSSAWRLEIQYPKKLHPCKK